MKVADNWNDVTIGQYQEIVNIQTDTNVSRIVEIISILADTDSETIRKLPLGEFFELSGKVEFINSTPDADVRRTFELDGKRYGLIPDMNFITSGEWLDADAWSTKPIDNLHLYCALLFRPIVWEEGDDYKIEEHKTEGFMRRAELFRDRLSINKVFGAQVFFSLFGIEYTMSIKDFLMEELKEEKKTGKTSKVKMTRPHMRKKSNKRSTKPSAGTT
jgi:hypothetical protein